MTDFDDAVDSEFENALEEITDGASLLHRISEETLNPEALAGPEAGQHPPAGGGSIIISNSVMTPEQSDEEDHVDEEVNSPTEMEGAIQLCYGDQQHYFKVCSIFGAFPCCTS